jgi:hypothetical protein
LPVHVFIPGVRLANPPGGRKTLEPRRDEIDVEEKPLYKRLARIVIGITVELEYDLGHGAPHKPMPDVHFASSVSSRSSMAGDNGISVQYQGKITMKAIQATLLVVSLLAPPALFASQTTDAMIGGGLGGAVGAAIGSELGGREGAILGGGLGGAAGVAVTTKDSDREVIHVNEQVNDYHQYYEGKRGGPPPWAPAHGYRRKHH